MSWLIGDWHTMLPPPLASVVLSALALVSGAIVGFERERSEKPAGLRTMALICFGACLLMLLSTAYETASGSRGRIAAQIVSGIGFLGGGVILRVEGTLVTGVTTAATIWAMAAIGMVAGAGYGAAALGSAVVVYSWLRFGTPLERLALGPCQMMRARVRFDPRGGRTRMALEEVLDDERIPPEQRYEQGPGQLEFLYCRRHRDHRDVIPRLLALPGVTAVDHAEPGLTGEPDSVK